MDNFTKRTILIVDDSKVNRLILKKILSDDYNIIEAYNGQIALDILNEKKAVISAILLDVVMPVMDGFSFLSFYNKDVNISSIPVLITTQLEGDDIELRALSLGAVDFIMKPYNPGIILKRLENTIKMHETSSFINAIERDSLTGLYNKQAFYQHASNILKVYPNENYDIIAVDIEKFKLVNDMYGIKEGDNLLKFIADNLIEFTKDCCSVCGRISGDKYVAIIPAKNKYETKLVDFILNALSSYYLKIKIIVRFGIYHIDDINIPVSTMCDRAHMATASIKGKYAHYIAYYEDSIINNMKREQEIVDEMNMALLNNEFQVYYQVKYDLENEKVVGAEALVRWNNPRKGFLPPDSFIPVFEKNGFITKLDLFVWEETCKLLRQRIDNGKDIFPISVNISRVDIFDPKIVEMLLNLINKYNLPTSLLRLEITETEYAENEEQMNKIVNELKKVGFYIEMDDFGSRYSSLNMLSKVNVDCIKLDMRFLRNLEEDKRTGGVLNFIISLAKWLGLYVVAEGVETLEQARFLHEMNCDYGQGYYFSKPLPMEEFIALIDSGKLNNMIGNTQQNNTGISINDIWNSNSTFNHIFDLIVDPVCICEYTDKKMNVIRANKEYYSIVSTKNTKSRNVLPIFHENDKILIQTLMEKNNNEFDVRKAEVRVKIAYDKEDYKWLRIHFKEIFSDVKRKLFMISFNDIDNIKQKELTLKKDSAFKNMIIDNSDNGVIVLSYEDFECKYVNNTLFSMLGYINRDELISFINPYYSIFAEKYVNTVRREFKKLLAAPINSSCHLLVELITKDNETSFMEMTAKNAQCKNKKYIIVIFNSAQSTFKYFANQYEKLSENLTISKGIFRYKVDGDGTIEYANDKFYEMLGYTKNEFEKTFNNNFYEMIYFEDVLRVNEEIQSQIATSDTDVCEYRVQTKNEGLKWFYDVGIIVTDIDGVRWFNVKIADNTQFHNQSEKIEFNKSQYELIMDLTQDMIFEWTLESQVVNNTQSFVDKFGYELPSQNFPYYFIENYIHPDDKNKAIDILVQLKKGKPLGCAEIRIRKIDGNYLWCKLSATSIANKIGKISVIMGVITDIDTQKTHMLEMQTTMQLDPLTSVLNRLAFENKVATIMEEMPNSSSAFIAIDVDNFKMVNDTIGHLQGDVILKKITKRMVEFIKNNGVVGRTGGDEFAIFINDLSTIFDMQIYMQEFLDYIRRPITIGNNEYIQTVSMGVIIIENNQNIDFTSYYKKADDLMYKSKYAGKNQFKIEYLK